MSNTIKVISFVCTSRLCNEKHSWLKKLINKIFSIRTIERYFFELDLKVDDNSRLNYCDVLIDSDGVKWVVTAIDDNNYIKAESLFPLESFPSPDYMAHYCTSPIYLPK